MNTKKVWTCKIGYAESLPAGPDAPMRAAVRDAYIRMLGKEPEFLFSGWGGELTENELAVVEKRVPEYDAAMAGLASAAMDGAMMMMDSLRKDRDNLSAELEAARKEKAMCECKWMDIETAPKDKSNVVLLRQPCGSVANGFFLAEAYAGNGAWIWPYIHKTPTHWMPPAAIAAQKGDAA